MDVKWTSELLPLGFRRKKCLEEQDGMVTQGLMIGEQEQEEQEVVVVVEKRKTVTTLP